jgi:hypothetical protein
MSSLPKLSEQQILEWVGDKTIFKLGRDYFQQNFISKARVEGSTLSASCASTGDNSYQLTVQLTSKGIGATKCSCPSDFECKHLVALLLQWLFKPESFYGTSEAPQQKSEKKENNSKSLTNLPAKLAALLKNVSRPGEFYASGSFATILPRIDIEQLGPLSFPVPSTQAEQIISIAERAPYGKGGETLVDAEVRRVWQLSPQKFKIDEKRWSPTLEKIIAEASKDLGVEGKVQAELYKMLIYDKGSFFVPHRDTEKTSGMFGTLIVVLPSWYEGGELIVSHTGREAHITLPSGDASGISWAAFYADCLHELRPVTEGYRLALVYNLLRTGKGTPPSPPDRRPEVTQVAKLLSQWSDALLGKLESPLPSKLAYILEHRYTPDSLSFSALKNADSASADVVKAAAREARCSLYLAMVSIEESGSAEYSGGGYYDDEDNVGEDDFEVIEVFDRTQQITQWRSVDDTLIHLAPLPFEDKEISPPDSLDSEASDEVSFHEATGNEGASFERTYRRAALVLWPEHRVFTVINQGGLRASLPYLTHLIEQWKKSKEPSSQSIIWQEAYTMAGWMIRTWPSDLQGGWDRDDQRETKMLALLNELKSEERSLAFVSDVLGGLHYNGNENGELLVVGLAGRRVSL